MQVNYIALLTASLSSYYPTQQNKKIKLAEMAEKILQKEPAIIPEPKPRIYSKKNQATEKLQKQLQFAIAEQKQEKAMGFTWDSPVETAFNIDIDNTQQLKVGMASTQGRRKEMEDTHLAVKISFTQNSKTYEGEFYGIFDGHGGKQVADHLNGRFKEVLENELNASEGETPSDTSITEALTRTFLTIHKEAREKYPSGATATGAFIFNGKIYVPNVGDARTILVKKGETLQLSEDAKPLNQRFHKQIKAVEDDTHRVAKYIYKKLPGGQTQIYNQQYDILRSELNFEPGPGQEAIGRIASKKNGNLSLAMARTVGDRLFELSAKPKITGLAKEEGDILVLACDGLWDVATTDEVGQAVKAMEAQGLDESQIASELTKAALKHGSNDNISVMVVKV